jgi:hypothetical protein
MSNVTAGMPFIALACVMFLTPVASGQKKHHQGRQEGAVATYSGQVEKVEQEQCSICKCVELSVALKSTADTLLVRLGPKQYFDERDFSLSKGDVIEVVGITLKEKGRTVVLATEVRKGSDTVMLRGKYGRPRWIQEHGHTCPQCGN